MRVSVGRSLTSLLCPRTHAATVSFYTEKSGAEPFKVLSGIRGDVRALVSVGAGCEVALSFAEGSWTLKPPPNFGTQGESHVDRGSTAQGTLDTIEYL